MAEPSMREQLTAVSARTHALMPPLALEAMTRADRQLETTGIVGRALGPGDVAPDFELPDAAGRAVRSADLRAKGPLVVSFYRGDWCPYCNIELRALQQHLPQIQASGATLVAISPQAPDRSSTMQEGRDIGFPVLSDLGNAVARTFGLVFQIDEALRPIYGALGVDLPSINGDATFELPLPATYVIGRDGRIVERFVSVDYRERCEPQTVLAWLDLAEARSV